MDITPLYTRLLIGSAPSTGMGLARSGVNTLVLCAAEYQPQARNFPGLRKVIHAPFSDDASPENFDVALKAAECVAREWKAGRTVLVTCMMGRNRSALVCVLALFMITGIPVEALIDRVRSLRRGPDGGLALANPAFIRFLRRIS